MSRIFARNLFALNQSSLAPKPLTMSATRNNCAVTNGKRLQGKVAIVTASTDGIGLAIVKRLAEDGAKVVVSSRKGDNVQRTVAELNAAGHKDVLGIKCHVGSKEDRHNMFAETIKRFGGLDILVSNAAVNPTFGPVMDCSEDAWDKIFDINVKSAFLLAQEAKPLLVKRGGGNVVFVSSIAGIQPFSLLGAYSVSKTALLGLTKAAAQSLVDDNIRVNCVAPGIIKTNFSKAMYESESALEHALSSIPMRKLGHVDNIAGVVSFLVSDDAAYITGETIVAAGGMQSRL